MARRLRFTPPGYWIHLTQRGNNQQSVFTTDADRRHFLSLLERLSEERDVRIAAFTLMTNHFHLVAVGDLDDAIPLFMMDLNSQYAAYRNRTQGTSGHVWQRRYYSCVLDTAHWEQALRYVELNAVRARIVKQAADHRWSSAPAHLGLAAPLAWLDTDEFLRRWPTPAHWLDCLVTLTRREVAALRRATRHDGVLGAPDFITQLEQRHAVRLRARPAAGLRKGPSRQTASLPANTAHA